MPQIIFVQDVFEIMDFPKSIFDLLSSIWSEIFQYIIYFKELFEVLLLLQKVADILFVIHLIEAKHL